MFNYLTTFLHEEESLALDLSEQLKKNPNKILKVFFIKIFRQLYRDFQRIIIYPSLREFFKYVEKQFFKSLNTKKINHSENIKKNSFTIIDNIFSQKQIKEIVKYIKNKKLISIYTGEKKFTLKNVPKDASMGYLETETLLNCPHILDRANDEKLHKILRGYFGKKYKLDWIWCWWSFPKRKKSVGPQMFHRDYENFNFVKVFVYLTDTGSRNGSHEVIKSSHRKNKLYSRRRYSIDEIRSNFNKKDIVKISGKSGKTFIENTFAIHRGNVPLEKKRLILCYMFSIVPSRRSPKIPFQKYRNIKSLFKKKKIDKYLNSLFLEF